MNDIERVRQKIEAADEGIELFRRIVAEHPSEWYPAYILRQLRQWRSGSVGVLDRLESPGNQLNSPEEGA